ncbi:hypothetical protein SDC9_201584 [bioreactor metagenome]|uniref:Uncharacterized protein n=1 Tax=bioreactor metagenome TaxID=1076179 RepID=A0A645IRD6_9ZZZZ
MAEDAGQAGLRHPVQWQTPERGDGEGRQLLRRRLQFRRQRNERLDAELPVQDFTGYTVAHRAARCQLQALLLGGGRAGHADCQQHAAASQDPSVQYRQLCAAERPEYRLHRVRHEERVDHRCRIPVRGLDPLGLAQPRHGQQPAVQAR